MPGEPQPLPSGVSPSDVETSQAIRTIGTPQETPFVNGDSPSTQVVQVAKPPESAPASTQPPADPPSQTPSQTPSDKPAEPGQTQPEGWISRQVGPRQVFLHPDAVQAFDAQAALNDAQNVALRRQVEQHRVAAVDARRHVQLDQQAAPEQLAFQSGISAEVAQIIASSTDALEQKMEAGGAVEKVLSELTAAFNQAVQQSHGHMQGQYDQLAQQMQNLNGSVKASAEATQPMRDQAALEAYHQTNLAGTEIGLLSTAVEAIKAEALGNGYTPDQIAHPLLERLIHSQAHIKVLQNGTPVPPAPLSPDQPEPASPSFPAPQKGPEQPRDSGGRFSGIPVPEPQRGSARAFTQ